MTDIKIAVKDNRAVLLRPADLVAGTVGQTCTFYFDNAWQNYSTKTITYKVGSTNLGTYEITGNSAVVPNKVLMMSGLPLEIALTAKSLSGAVVPTSWCHIGVIQQGAAVIGEIEDSPEKPGKDEIIYDGGSVEGSVGDDLIYEGGGI